MADLVKDIIARSERMRGDRSTHDTDFQKIRDVLFPSGAAFTSTETPGARQGLKVLNNTGEQAAELLAAALVAGATPADMPFIGIKAVSEAANRDYWAARWLELVTNDILAVLSSPSTNFRTEQHVKMIELVTYGSACMFTEERGGQQLPLMLTRPLNECYFAESAEGKVDTVYRCFEWTARQAVQRWGNRAGKSAVQHAGTPGQEETRLKFIQAVYPRADRDPQKLPTGRNMAWASCWVNVDDQHEIAQGGYNEFPATCPRWRKRAGETYGRGPGHKALLDVMMLQRAMKVTIRGVEKRVDPPLIVADDGVLSPIRVTPSGINYVRADTLTGQSSPIRGLDTGGDPTLGDAFNKAIEERIQFAFYTHLIQFARDPQMTATQFLGITEQTSRVLAPILERLQVEDLDPIVRRVYAIRLRQGAYPPAPEALQGQELRIEYQSPATRAQKAGEARAFAQTMEILTPAVNAGHEEILDNFEFDAASRDLGEINGMRRAWIRPPEKVAAIRQARARAAEQQAQLEAGQQQADTAFTSVKALGELRNATQPARAS